MTKKVTGNLHERAHRLIDQERLEDLPPEDRRWLEDHLAACEACAGWAESTDAALRALKSVSVAVPPGLAASAKLIVREEAAKLKQRRSRNLALITGCAISWALGVASAPLVWRLCEWIGATFALPRFVWIAGFACWWFVPAAAAGLVILWAQARAERERFDASLETRPRAGRW